MMNNPQYNKKKKSSKNIKISKSLCNLISFNSINNKKQINLIKVTQNLNNKENNNNSNNKIKIKILNKNKLRIKFN